MDSAIRNSERLLSEALSWLLPDARSGQVHEVYLGRNCESMAYSGYGKFIAVGVETDVFVLEADTLAVKFRFKGHKGIVRSVSFSPQSSKIVSGSLDKTVRVWNLTKPDDDALALEGHTREVSSVCASAEGLRVALGSSDNSVRLWNLVEKTGEREETKGRSKWISCFNCTAA